MTRSVTFLCLGLFLVTIAVWLPNSVSLAQEGTAFLREMDERVATVEERQRLVATLPAQAEQLRNAGDLENAAGLLNRAGRFQKRLHRPQEALTTFQHALSLVKYSPDSPSYIESLNGSAAVFTQLSKCEEALESLGKALSGSESSGNIAGKAEALLIQSDCQNHTDHALALKTAQKSLALWQSLNHKWGSAKTYSAIGYYQFAQNDLNEASRSHNAALDLWRELNTPAEQGEALINLAFIEYRRGAWQSSLTLLTQAQGLTDEKAEPFRMGQITGGMAEAFIETGLPEIGLKKAELATEYFRLAESPRAGVVMSWVTGRAHLLSGNYAEAISTLQHGLSNGKLLKESVMVGLCNEFLGRTYSELNEFSTALSHYQAALEQYRSVSNPMEAARTQALIGQVYQRQGKIEMARKEYQTALQTFRRLSDHLNESATLYALGSLELKQNNLDLAEDYLQESIDVTENIRRDSTSNDLAAAFSATVHERYESLVDCLMRKHESDPTRGLAVRAFETSELSRARSLSELLRATQTNLIAGLDPQLAAEEKSLRQSLRVKEDEKVGLLGRHYQAAELTALEQEIQQLEARYQQVTDAIRAQHPSFKQLDRPSPLDLREIQQQIVGDAETVLLEYILGKDRSYVWAVTRDGFASYNLPGR